MNFFSTAYVVLSAQSEESTPLWIVALGAFAVVVVIFTVKSIFTKKSEDTSLSAHEIDPQD